MAGPGLGPIFAQAPDLYFPAFHRLGDNRERSASDRLQMTAQAKAPTTDNRTRELLVNGDSRPLGQGIVTIRVKALVLGCRCSSRGRRVAPLQCCPLVLAMCPGSCIDFREPSPLLLQSQGAVLPDKGLPSISCLAGAPMRVHRLRRVSQGHCGGKAPTVTPSSDPGVGRRACVKRALISSSQGAQLLPKPQC